jgi:hypothetical protein
MASPVIATKSNNAARGLSLFAKVGVGVSSEIKAGKGTHFAKPP